MPNFQAQPSLPTVLLIDDDLVSREVMATVLTMSGYTVHTAAGGAAALELLDGGKCVPGVILMDAQMPGLSGIRLIEELRARSQAGVFAISGSGAPDDVVAAADGFLLTRPRQALLPTRRHWTPLIPSSAPKPWPGFAR